MKRLLLTCTDLMAIQFMVPHIKYLSNNGYSVKLACSVVGDRLDDLHSQLDGIAEIETVRLVRSPFSPSNLNGLNDLKRIINREKWDIIWTNEPVMGIMTRLAAKKARSRGTKVVYMVHGFHFYKGASILNWAMFYPVEKYCSRLCDTIITINTEDFERAKTFHAKDVKMIDGIGVDVEMFTGCVVQKNEKRRELGIPEDAFFILSIGELQKRKNHEVIIKALGQLKNDNIYYGICGKGELEEYLKELASKRRISERVLFFGYRNDIKEVLKCADVFAHPSKREGLGLAALEAMASGIPLLTSNIGGIGDYVVNGETGYLYAPDDVDGFSNGINIYYSSPEICEKISENGSKAVKKYDIRKAEKTLCDLFGSM